ncbi:MAG: hypothetical protein ACI4KJ_05120 [Anaerovoracaceae bacterium]
MKLNTIPELEVRDIRKLASRADNEANPLYPVPRLMSAAGLEDIYCELLD